MSNIARKAAEAVEARQAAPSVTKALANEIKAALGDRDTGLVHGLAVTYRARTRRAHTVAESTYRTLAITWKDPVVSKASSAPTAEERQGPDVTPELDRYQGNIAAAPPWVPRRRPTVRPHRPHRRLRQPATRRLHPAQHRRRCHPSRPARPHPQPHGPVLDPPYRDNKKGVIQAQFQPAGKALSSWPAARDPPTPTPSTNTTTSRSPTASSLASSTVQPSATTAGRNILWQRRRPLHRRRPIEVRGRGPPTTTSAAPRRRARTARRGPTGTTRWPSASSARTLRTLVLRSSRHRCGSTTR